MCVIRPDPFDRWFIYMFLAIVAIIFLTFISMICTSCNRESAAMFERDKQEITAQAKKSAARDLREVANRIEDKPDLTISGANK